MPLAPEAWLWGAIETATSYDAYPLSAPDNAAAPYVVFARTGTTRTNDLGGPADVPAGQFSVEIYCDGYKAGKDLADLVRGGLNGVSGDFTVSEGTVTILGVELIDERDGPPVLLEGRERPTYVIEQDYTITWQE